MLERCMVGQRYGSIGSRSEGRRHVFLRVSLCCFIMCIQDEPAYMWEVPSTPPSPSLDHDMPDVVLTASASAMHELRPESEVVLTASTPAAEENTLDSEVSKLRSLLADVC